MRTDTGTTEIFDILTGVTEGCILSPFLFLLAVDFIMQRVVNQPTLGIQWKEQCLTDLDFANDMVLLGEMQESLQEIISRMGDTVAKVGLRINSEKMMVMQSRCQTGVQLVVGQ